MELLVAIVLLAITVLLAGHAVASALRLGHRGLAGARLAAALMVQASSLDASAYAGAPCSGLATGARRHGDLAIRWRTADPRSPGELLLEATLPAGARPMVDSITVRLACR